MDDMHDDLAKMKAIVENEKEGLKDNRVYLVMENTDDSIDQFFMFCLDKTNNDDGPANMCQVLAKGLVHILQNSAEEVYSLGQKLIEEDEYSESNIISLDSYRNNDYAQNVFKEKDREHLTVTVTLEDEDDDRGA
tara:strand:+ start:378 stop:782 length:405 start_codon:yes stop_codon:yes gene_type:complete